MKKLEELKIKLNNFYAKMQNFQEKLIDLSNSLMIWKEFTLTICKIEMQSIELNYK